MCYVFQIFGGGFREDQTAMVAVVMKIQRYIDLKVQERIATYDHAAQLCHHAEHHD